MHAGFLPGCETHLHGMCGNPASVLKSDHPSNQSDEVEGFPCFQAWQYMGALQKMFRDESLKPPHPGKNMLLPLVSAQPEQHLFLLMVVE
ncbi:MAG: hypothetical protein CVU41_07555 [Chloroflexi bacterium HGW-Chloroflexi-3]|nr:MAG: hypothetical protein CVU41_07555 [Chloroflexi bacterium HGW-Chloroflexi-3]